MPRFNVNAPDGSVIPVDAPEGATEQDAIAFAAATWKPKAKPASLPPMPGSEIPQWGRDNPRLYGVAGALRETLGLPAEALTTAAGGILGAPLGPVASIGGAGLGYGIGKAATRRADELLGNAAPLSLGQGLTQAVNDVATGATMEGVGRIAAPAIAKGVGWVGDRLVGPSLAKLNAAKIARDVAGAKLPQVQQAIANAPSNITAAQAIQEAGVNSPPMQALGDLAARKASTHFSDQLIQQEAERLAALKAAAPDAAVAREARKAFSPMNYDAAIATDEQRIMELAQKRAHNAVFGGAGGAVPVQPLTPELQALKGIPEIDAAIKEARTRIAGGGDKTGTLQSIRKTLTPASAVSSVDNGALIDIPRQQQIAQLQQQIAQQEAYNTAFRGVGGTVPVTKISPELQALSRNPTPRTVITSVKNQSPGGGDPMETLRGLHTMKEVLDSWSKSPVLPNSLQTSDKRAITAANARLVEVMDSMSPEYAVARAKDAAMRVPENQGNLLNNLASILNNKGVGENRLAFLNAIGRGEDAALKGSGVNPRFGTIKTTLNQPQNAVVDRIGDELARDIRMGKAAKEGSTELAAILDKDTLSLRKLIPNLMNRTVTGTVKALDLAEAALSRKTTEALTEAMKSGKNLQDLFNTIPMSERNKILKVMIDKDPSLLVRTARIAPGAATVNALSSRRNENALAD